MPTHKGTNSYTMKAANVQKWVGLSLWSSNVSWLSLMIGAQTWMCFLYLDVTECQHMDQGSREGEH